MFRHDKVNYLFHVVNLYSDENNGQIIVFLLEILKTLNFKQDGNVDEKYRHLSKDADS